MATFKVPSNWGLCFAGNQTAFCNALDLAIKATGSPFEYVEIGIGYGQTINAVCEYLVQHGIEFNCTGVDLDSFAGNASIVSNYAFPNRVTLSLVGAARHLTGMKADGKTTNFVFIDGCHGAQCVMDDFMAAERVIKPGGVIAFHDTDPGCQDIHFQPHCKTGIRAREGVEKLGLLDDSRPGWRKIDETSGLKDQGGHGCLFVQRVNQ
jgi:hypothetical protein